MNAFHSVTDAPGRLAGEASLGKDAKSHPTFENWVFGEPGTGEIIPVVQDRQGNVKPAFDLVKVHLERFAIHSAVRRILMSWRVSNCLRAFAPVRGGSFEHPEVWRSAKHGGCRYHKLLVCASVWVCPNCAATISERRRAELKTAIDAHRANGGEVYLLTLTNPHTASDSLHGVLEAQAKAMTRFHSQRASVAFWNDIGSIGTVRAWEVTHGQNGWHPHFHILIFARFGLNLPDLEDRLHDLWANACRLAGLRTPSREHGVTFQDGDEAGAYASKWGLESELTKGHTKKASKGRTPFDLLRSYLYDDDRQAAALFRDFAHSFKGKRQLVWSRGLKAQFQVEEQTDEECVTKLDEGASLIGRIQFEDWRLILKADARGDVLELARFGWEPVERFLSELRRGVSK